VAGFADKLMGEDRIILSVRPGITGPATLKYRKEEEFLASQDDPEKYNDEVIFPDKVRLNREYVANYSFWKDLKYIYQTIFRNQRPEIRVQIVRSQRSRNQKTKNQKDKKPEDQRSEGRTRTQIGSRKCKLNRQRNLLFTKKRMRLRCKYSELARIGRARRNSP
jgi:hypothetical protein